MNGVGPRVARAESELKVADIMSRHVHACSVGDTLDVPARLMWEHDCGAIPVLDARGRAAGMVTDRDVCMAAYTQGRPLCGIGVMTAASPRAYCIRSDASIGEAHHLMKSHRVRRLPVVDAGNNLVGLLSLADVIRHARTTCPPHDPLHVEKVASTLTEVFRPHASGVAPRSSRSAPPGARS